MHMMTISLNILECPNGNDWLQQDEMPNFVLQFNLQTMSHAMAKQSCEDSGNRLVRIDSKEKREYIKGIGTLCEGIPLICLLPFIF
jgi:hypothetical protein